MTVLNRDQVRLSKRMSLVLRHRPETAGLTLDANGWVPVAELLAALGVTRAELDQVVAHNDKARFAVSTGPDGVDRIRASQGHSRRVAVDLDLPPAVPPAELFHGTPRANLEAILREGLRPRSRHHVHLSVDVPTAVTVGRRRSPDVVVLRVAAGVMAEQGHVFHRSDNGVWLTAIVPSQHLSEKRTNP
ncbi:RNA 2'-phosphotransferase [Actinoplanes hulinensis]|uniref:Probable RNA 2'-phosphotransferase n=2 Tax=Actinoplanes TaxID=1865 RepID=A0A7W5APG6_9ACTN|nr:MULTISPECIES: RNA 2'-phosphotransferase [Actinoplanes]MBB3099619.1 putative RNA 2'-phosphotransferase [Actinoplanes campanulatus]MBW6438195.1 RNA 2'-phosphotransferase [Actinoplanes hulinensis]GGN26174.1 putative RNA 2'-phosphotransferase [Actinoplanes campanulatus]GID41511.1 putative RNA 2'-phosphotransferase [Actinoplanes campanulatus]